MSESSNGDGFGFGFDPAVHPVVYKDGTVVWPDGRRESYDECIAGLDVRHAELEAEVAELEAENAELERSNDYCRYEVDEEYWRLKRAGYVAEHSGDERVAGNARIELDRRVSSGFGVRPVDLDKVKPVEFVHRHLIVRGRLNEVVGREDVGKSTFEAWIAARLTKGELPGCFEGTPVKVLFIGCDEDDFNRVTVPRLMAAGADLAYIREFYALNEEDLFNVEDHASDLGRLLGEEDFGLVVIEHVMDVLPRMKNPYDPMALRRALRPLQRVLGAQDGTALTARHTNKAPGESFRQRAQGGVQFSAVGRSSFLLDDHPDDPTRRVAVLGKANYVPESERHALAFSIVETVFDLNGETFRVGRVDGVEQTDLTIASVLSGPARPPRPNENEIAVLRAIEYAESPPTTREISVETGLKHSTLYDVMGRLKKRGEICQSNDVWHLSVRPDLLKGTRTDGQPDERLIEEER